jgi:hypothetical protein
MDSRASHRRTPHRGRGVLLVSVVAAVVSCVLAGETGSVAAASARTRPAAIGGTARTGTMFLRLLPFLYGAQEVDARIRSAARRINEDLEGTGTVRFRSSTVEAVAGLGTEDLGRTIPAGMPEPLLRLTLLVLSDLTARHCAMRSVLAIGTIPFERSSKTFENLLGCLGNGTVPAQRYPGDLTQLYTLAQATALSLPVAVSSRATAEVLVRTRYIEASNIQNTSCGGLYFTELVPLVWESFVTSHGIQGSGWIGVWPFTAEYDPARGWMVDLLVP